MTDIKEKYKLENDEYVKLKSPIPVSFFTGNGVEGLNITHIAKNNYNQFIKNVTTDNELLTLYYKCNDDRYERSFIKCKNNNISIIDAKVIDTDDENKYYLVEFEN